MLGFLYLTTNGWIFCLVVLAVLFTAAIVFLACAADKDDEDNGRTLFTCSYFACGLMIPIASLSVLSDCHEGLMGIVLWIAGLYGVAVFFLSCFCLLCQRYNIKAVILMPIASLGGFVLSFILFWIIAIIFGLFSIDFVLPHNYFASSCLAGNVIKENPKIGECNNLLKCMLDENERRIEELCEHKEKLANEESQRLIDEQIKGIQAQQNLLEYRRYKIDQMALRLHLTQFLEKEGINIASENIEREIDAIYNNISSQHVK